MTSLEFEEIKRILLDNFYIHDAEILEIMLSSENYQPIVRINFLTTNEIKVQVNFMQVSKVSFFDDKGNSVSRYVSCYKFIRLNEKQCYISLDPDESSIELLEDDNDIIVFEKIEIKVNGVCIYKENEENGPGH